MNTEEELRCYKALYLKYLLEKYQNLILFNSSIIDSIKEYLDFRRKQITKIYNELFETKIEDYNIDWLSPHQINNFLYFASELGMYTEESVGIDLRSMNKKGESEEQA